MSSIEEARRFPAGAVYDFVERIILAAGIETQSAKATARGLWHASIRGVDSHGLRLLPHYAAVAQGGRVNPDPNFHFEQTAAAAGRLDADHGFGHAAGMEAMRRAISLAKEAGTGHVAVRNSTHCGAMAYFALEACKQDMLGLAYTNATPRMHTPNATDTTFGTNPICFTAPMRDEAPFSYDGSTTQLSMNKIRVYGERGLTLPPGCGADAQGRETNVPGEVVQLLPIGDYKGFGIAMMVDILCALLTGMPAGKDVSDMFKDAFSEKRMLGHFFGAIRIDAFVDPAEFKARLQTLAEEIRAQPRANPGTPVQVPGDPEKACEADRRANGIPIIESDLRRFAEVADQLGVPALAQ